MHNLIGRVSQYVREPSFHSSSVQISTTLMRHRKISRPSIDGNGVADNETVVPRPSRAHGFQIGVASFEINCYFFRC